MAIQLASLRIVYNVPQCSTRIDMKDMISDVYNVFVFNFDNLHEYLKNQFVL